MKPKRTILAVVSVFAALAIAGDFRASAAEAAKKDDAKPAPAAAAVEMAPIDLKLPAPYFGGTPLTYGNEHYEEPSPVPRAPFQAPKGAAVLSQGKPVTSSCANPVFGKLPMITDGEKGYQTDFVTELSTGTQWVQIDLGEACEV
ncbi:MAG: hypothetical protein FJY92_04665, partial [Candidatus Hydrogenedentes bacterium]|nr:hypothetical protein [Candidatus Hydrogenedentota bacterium]